MRGPDQRWLAGGHTRFDSLRSAGWSTRFVVWLVALVLSACLSEADRDRAVAPISEDPRADASVQPEEAYGVDGGPGEGSQAGDAGAGGFNAGGIDAGARADDAGEPFDAGVDAGEHSAPDEEEPSDAGPEDASVAPDASRDAGKPYTGIGDAGPIVVAPWTFTPNPGADPSFTAVYTFLRGNCRGCHGSSPNGLDLSSREGAYLSLIGGPAMGASEMYCGKPFYKVIPGEPAKSLLFLKMYGKQVCGFDMPPGVTNSQGNLSTVWRWIENGALND